MWQAPNQRVRAAANAKRREREKARKPIHIKRITAQLELVSAQGEGNFKTGVRLILNDLSGKGVGFFSSAALVPGQEITLGITDPHKLNLKARVIWCQEHAANSHVISNQPYSYRVGVEFILANEQEGQAIRDFCDEICKNYLYAIRSA